MVVGYLAAMMARDESPRSLGSLHSKITVRRGAEILEGPYPKRFTEFVGQENAVLQIITAVTSAIERQVPMRHVLLASGYPGVGKTALGRLTADLLGTGFVELGGKVKDVDAAAAIRLHAYKRLYIEAEEKLVYARYFGVKVDRGTAAHSVKASEFIVSGGFSFR